MKVRDYFVQGRRAAGSSCTKKVASMRFLVTTVWSSTLMNTSPRRHRGRTALIGVMVSVSIWSSHIISPWWSAANIYFRSCCRVPTASPPMAWPHHRGKCGRFRLGTTAARLTLAGGGWRLPTLRELEALYKEKLSASAIAGYPGMDQGWY
jgi:hypothetical protein